MGTPQLRQRELAVITQLVSQASQNLGRTALMKSLYFLKTLRGVPLNYNFSLYTYGPFDADVLDDLQYAESLGMVRSKVVPYPTGYGYELKKGPNAAAACKEESPFLTKHKKDIEWVLKEFGTRTAADLEMLSTLVFADFSAGEQKRHVSLDEIVSKVGEIKPCLDKERIRDEATRLMDQRLLKHAR